MARLAEILREKNVVVLRCTEKADCHAPSVEFWYGEDCEFDYAEDLKEVVESIGYRVSRRYEIYDYGYEHEEMGGPFPYDCFEFEIT